MFISRLVMSPLRPLWRATGGGHLQPPVRCILSGSLRPAPFTYRSFQSGKHSENSAAADKTYSRPRWVWRPEPEEAAAMPRKMSLSPLGSWLSLRYSLPLSPLERSWLSLHYSLPPSPEAPRRPPQEVVLPPPFSAPVLAEEEDVAGDGESSPVAPPPLLSCKNVLEIRRRKMTRHKYRKLRKRMRFVRGKVLQGQRKRKQRRFEEDLERIWRRAGLKEPPRGWSAPKIYLRRQGNSRG